MISRLIVHNYDGQIEFESTQGKGSTFTFTFHLFSSNETLSENNYLDSLPKFEDESLDIRVKTEEEDDDSSSVDMNEVEKKAAGAGNTFNDGLMDVVSKLEIWRTRGMRILIVDDEPMCRIGLKSLLEVCKVDEERIDCAQDGLQAISVVKEAIQLGFNYSIIFMDINMPNMDGIEATKEIRRIYANDNPKAQKPIIIGCTGHYEPAFIQKSMKAGMNSVEAKPMQLAQLRTIIKENFAHI